MKRVFKIGERVWWEDDYMNGWGTLVLVNRDASYPEYICSDYAGDILTIAKDEGGEIETSPSCVYQIAPGRFFWGEVVCWEHNETDESYPFFCPERYENCFHFEVEPTL